MEQTCRTMKKKEVMKKHVMLFPLREYMNLPEKYMVPKGITSTKSR